MTKTPSLICVFATLTLAGGVCVASPSHDALAHDVLEELVNINTAPSGGNDTRQAVAGLVRRLKNAGFEDRDVQVLAQSEKLPNLVVRYRSEFAARKPLLMMAHIDVVEALPDDWSVDPFKMIEKDGYYYGRGTTDNKAGAAMLVANLIRLKNENFKPDRDLIVMLTADEETTGDAAQWLLTEHRAAVDAEFALNTDGGMVIHNEGPPRAFLMQTSEKIYVTFELEALDPGGHSSLPRTDSAISRLARTLVSLYEYQFPVDLNETTRAFFTEWLSLAPPADRPLIEALLSDSAEPDVLDRLADQPYYNALARTTCVATQLSGGHAENALPQSAKAIVNCRVLPHSSAAAVQMQIEKFAASNNVSVSPIYEPKPSPPSPLEEAVVGPVTEVARALWPEISVIPEMSTGATDGLFVRNAGIPVYGVSAIAEDPDDIRAHGQDERIPVQSFRDATEYWYQLVKVLSQPRRLTEARL